MNSVRMRETSQKRRTDPMFILPWPIASTKRRHGKQEQETNVMNCCLRIALHLFVELASASVGQAAGLFLLRCLGYMKAADAPDMPYGLCVSEYPGWRLCAAQGVVLLIQAGAWMFWQSIESGVELVVTTIVVGIPEKATTLQSAP
ncbi:hypothetical protein Nepgr_033660 [Nepenthes gracilis]|uniref:Uncharacterized protein n=1 Tax=Nepenthes gracilis TaxID=150966 RepID=A0AAD3Y930_NEPGR|nr:hypothetical protein Nepgr_033660 [Nepenthes gracilis]